MGILDYLLQGRNAYQKGLLQAPDGAAAPVENYQQPKLNPNLKRGEIFPIGYAEDGTAEWAIPQGLLDVGESISRMSEASNPYTPFPYENYGDITGDALNVGVLGGATSFATKGVPKGALGAFVYQGGPNKYGREGASESLKHIGKGEGAQVYGYGRYDAEAQDVAEMYQKQLKYERINDPQTIVERAVDDINYYNGNEEAAISAWESGVKNSSKDSLNYKLNKEKLDAWNNGEVKRESYLYKHDLPDEDIANYLDWDKPLSEQPQIVKDFFDYKPDILAEKFGNYKSELIRKYGQRFRKGATSEELDKFDSLKRMAGDNTTQDKSGKQLYEGLSAYASRKSGNKGDSVVGLDDKGASELLGKAGIGGLKYLDGTSRAGGEGTRNFVTWSQDVLDRMELLERNGVDMREPQGLLQLTDAQKAATDRTEAFEIAQKNAAKPVSEGGLGLPKDNTAADRAKAMGFNVDAYHGTNQGAYTKKDIEVFNTRPDSMRGAAFFSSKPELAQQYGEKVYDVLLRRDEPLTVHGDGRSWLDLGESPMSGNLTQKYADLRTKKNEDLQAIFEDMAELFDDIDTPKQAEKIIAGVLENKQVSSMPNISGSYIATDDIAKASRDLGYDFVHFKDIYDSPTSGIYEKVNSDVYAVHNPKNIRSKQAAFDPARKDSADILAANPELMGLLGFIQNGGNNDR